VDRRRDAIGEPDDAAHLIACLGHPYDPTVVIVLAMRVAGSAWLPSHFRAVRRSSFEAARCAVLMGAVDRTRRNAAIASREGSRNMVSRNQPAAHVTEAFTSSRALRERCRLQCFQVCRSRFGA
jgi:hypothetical protein